MKKPNFLNWVAAVAGLACGLLLVATLALFRRWDETPLPLFQVATGFALVGSLVCLVGAAMVQLRLLENATAWIVCLSLGMCVLAAGALAIQLAPFVSKIDPPRTVVGPAMPR